MKRVYLDHNATTPMRPEVRDLWVELLGKHGGNPSSLHASGRLARNLIDDARARIATCLDVSESSVVFTSGGTEANNLAIFGVGSTLGPDRSVLTSPIEHASVLEPMARLAAGGRKLHYAGVSKTGRIHPEQLAYNIEANSVGLVSLHLANNEIGVVQPMRELSAGIQALPEKSRPVLHVDAVQATGRIDVSLALEGVDLYTMSMHKIGGPLGVGVLVKRPGTAVAPLVHGGGQEEELRAGTENAPAIAASALAMELALAEQAVTAQNHRLWCNQIWRILSARFPELELSGPALEKTTDRLPGTMNIRMPGTEARMLVTRFDMEGVELSAGSACASGAVEASHVLLALGLSESDARSGLRISMGWNTSEADCKRAVERMVKVFSSSRATCGGG
ncbi:MAG: cysteine desulfurase [Bacteroidia bacterium]|jgi:cysteine desulfurase